MFLFYFFFLTDPSDWEQKLLPNFEALKVLIDEAMAGRTLEEFAALCGTNASKLSRIRTGKFKKPLDVELLQAIAANAPKGSKATLANLLYANGMRPKEGTEAAAQCNEVKEKTKDMKPIAETSDAVIVGNQAERDRFRNRMLERRQQEDRIRELITSALLKRGAQVYVQQFRGADGEISTPYGYRVYPDFHFGVDIFEGIKEWNIDILPMASSAQMPKSFIQRHVLERLASYFVIDSWSPEVFQDTKTTFVFTNEDTYSAVKEKLLNARPNNCFTMMLIDNGQIVEETVIGTKKWRDVLLSDIPESKPEDDFQDSMDVMRWHGYNNGEDDNN